MHSIKNNFLYFIIFTVFVQIKSLVEIRVEDSNILITEEAVRKTVNSIFSTLHLADVAQNPRLKEFAAIHNFFVTVTLQDHENLKEIERLTKVDNIDNNTQYFITKVNEILNEDNKSYNGTDDEYVTAHVETFIRKLEYLKFKYGFANNDANFSIKPQVLNHLLSGDTLENSTETSQEANDTDGKILTQSEFWKPKVSRRIFEGKRSKISEFPFVASVQFFRKFQCGGSIIHKDLVITSASCLQLAWNNRFFRENPAFLSVQVGCDLYEAGDENIPILEVYFHPDYNPKNLRNNLAIMRLERVLKFRTEVKRIKKIDIDRTPAQLSANTPGITIIGWGARTSTNIVRNIWRNRLASARLDFYPYKDCQEVYSKEYVDHKNFCAGFISKGGGACNRDAGGPGVAYGKLVGVISFGAPNCGTLDAPTVFTKLGFYTDWIENIMEMEPPTVARSTTERTTRISIDLDQFLTKNWNTYKVQPVTESSSEEDRLLLREKPTPILRKETPAVFTEATPSVLTEPPQSDTEDGLRTLDENELFKDFISTMFGDEDVKEYLEEFETNNKKPTKHRAVTGPSKVEFKPTESTREDETVESPLNTLRIITTKQELDELKKITTDQNIARLINDIDVKELLTSSNENSFESKKKTSKGIEPFQAQVQKIERPVKIAESKEESSSSDDTSDYDSGYEPHYTHVKNGTLIPVSTYTTYYNIIPHNTFTVKNYTVGKSMWSRIESLEDKTV